MHAKSSLNADEHTVHNVFYNITRQQQDVSQRQNVFYNITRQQLDVSHCQNVFCTVRAWLHLGPKNDASSLTNTTGSILNGRQHRLLDLLFNLLHNLLLELDNNTLLLCPVNWKWVQKCVAVAALQMDHGP